MSAVYNRKRHCLLLSIFHQGCPSLTLRSFAHSAVGGLAGRGRSNGATAVSALTCSDCVFCCWNESCCTFYDEEPLSSDHVSCRLPCSSLTALSRPPCLAVRLNCPASCAPPARPAPARKCRAWWRRRRGPGTPAPLRGTCPRPVLAAPATTADQNPAAVYLASLAPGSRPSFPYYMAPVCAARE
jgi:hypothetical protein